MPTVLDAALAGQLQTYLTKVVRPVVLVSSLDGSTTSVQLAGLLDDIVEASGGRVTHDRTGVGTRRPSFRVVGSRAEVQVGDNDGDRDGDGDGDGDEPAYVEFAGVPLGHELTSLVLAILQVGGHPSTADAALIERVRSLTGTHHFETFFSQSCQNCPDVVQALNLMAVLNPGITHTAIDGASFPAEATERGVLAVPTVFLDGEVLGQGRMTLAEILEKVNDGAASAESTRLDGLDPFDVLVLGGGPAGATAAVYAARKGIRTGLVAERFGGQLLDTMTIENYPSVAHTEGPRMAADLEAQVRSYGVEIVVGRQVSHLATSSEPGGLHEITLDSGATLSARSVIIATGARWRTMGVPGEQDYRNRGVTFCPHCDGPLFAGKPVAVVGGGNSGVEAAIDLAGIAAHVTLVEYLDELRADEVLQRTLRSLPNVTVLTGTRTTEVVGDGTRVSGIRLDARDGDEVRDVEVAGVFVQIGLLPNTEWADGTVARTERGEIIVDARGATNVLGVFAAGDCTTSPFKQIAVATGSGATASLSAFDHLIRTTEAALVG